MSGDFYHLDKARQYMADVLDGTIPACIYVKQAVERQVRDLEKQDTDEFPYLFDEAAAERICTFISLLPHIKGRWARERRLIELEPWQCFILSTVFGWLNRETRLRRYRTAYEEVARKNAKSTKISGVGLYLLTADEEEGAEVYSAATTRDQARIVWKDAKAMVDRSEGLRDRFGVQTSARSVFVNDTSSMFIPLSRDQGGNHDGLNVHGALIDELHAHKTRDIFDVIETATGARDQSLIWIITTAGFNRAGICYEQRDYAIKLLSQAIQDESYFAIIYTVDPEDLESMDKLLSDPDIWRKANPNWGVSVSPEDIERKAKKAREQTSAQPNFLTKHLNVWVNADTACFDMYRLEKCVDHEMDIKDFYGEKCRGGLDLASKLDVASKGLLFERDNHYYWFDNHYLPEETIENSSNSQYQGWAADGHFIETPGPAIDYDWIEEDILGDDKDFDVVQFGFDPHQATQLVSHMLDKGVEMVEVRPTVLNYSEPLKELQRLIIEGRLHYNGNPVMTWMFSNTVGHFDAKDNIYPRKEFKENKIDGVIALLTALYLHMRMEDDDGDFEEMLARPIHG